MCIPRKISFLQLGRCGRRKEQRYRQTFRKDFDWLCFNMNLTAERFQYGMKMLAIAPAEGEAYELVAWSKSLKRKVRPVLHYLPGGAHRLYFCTDTDVCGMDVYDIYRTRFRIEFCFRDGHQFTGLLDCQARGEKALDLAYNASLAAVKVTKVLRKQTGTPFSIGQIKPLMVNVLFIRRFFELSGIDPHRTLNAKLVKELFGLAVDAV